MNNVTLTTSLRPSTVRRILLDLFPLRKFTVTVKQSLTDRGIENITHTIEITAND